MNEARKQAAGRVCRITCSDDGSYDRPYQTPDACLSLRLRHVAKAQVDAVFCCAGNTTIFRGDLPKWVTRVVSYFRWPGRLCPLELI